VNGIIFISLLLNAVCIYFIYLLWKKIDENHKNAKSTDHIEELLELFSQEMRFENERLYKLISDFSSKNEQGQREIHEKTNEKEIEAINSVALKKENNDQVDEVHNQSETKPETNKVIILAKQGYNAEQIAKMLNRGKGEVELLLKFYA
jgi:DNA-directed RNA polymerase specialized sigma24 family protein